MPHGLAMQPKNGLNIFVQSVFVRVYTDSRTKRIKGRPANAQKAKKKMKRKY